MQFHIAVALLWNHLPRMLGKQGHPEELCQRAELAYAVQRGIKDAGGLAVPQLAQHPLVIWHEGAAVRSRERPCA
eukprot:3792742-Alexandrium_andersonii.AAC.1